jgi:hypothetical protein
MSAVPELWQRALFARAKALSIERNRGARARLALVALLRRCQQDVDLVTVHTWSRALQGHAYLWGVAYLAGREDLPPPWKL